MDSWWSPHTCHQVNLDFIRGPSGVSGLYQDVWGSVTYSPGSEIVSLHISNMPNKMLWHTEHIAYIPMVQKSSVCTWQTCQIECYCNPNIYLVSVVAAPSHDQMQSACNFVHHLKLQSVFWWYHVISTTPPLSTAISDSVPKIEPQWPGFRFLAFN